MTRWTEDAQGNERRLLVFMLRRARKGTLPNVTRRDFCGPGLDLVNVNQCALAAVRMRNLGLLRALLSILPRRSK